MIPNTRSTTRRFAAIITAAFAFVSCSASDSTTPASETPSETSPSTTSQASVETTTTSDPTTTTTSAPTSTSTEPAPVVDTVPPTDSTEPPPETTALPTTVGPNNTIFDPNTLEGEVEQATLANLDAFVGCLDELPDCDVANATRFSALEYADGNVDLLTDWVEAGFETRNINDYNFRVDSVEVFEEVAEALVEVCIWGGTQLVAPATDVEPEQLIDGDYSSSRQRYLVRQLNGDWLVTANDVLETVVGREKNICL